LFGRKRTRFAANKRVFWVLNAPRNTFADAGLRPIQARWGAYSAPPEFLHLRGLFAAEKGRGKRRIGEGKEGEGGEGNCQAPILTTDRRPYSWC